MKYERALELRQRLVALTLEWEWEFGVAPSVTSAIAEVDAARLVDCPYDDYCQFMRRRTAVSRGHDFEHGGLRYQVKANRPSGKPGSPVTLTSTVKNYDWDRFIWILYAKDYRIEEAWIWTDDEFRSTFELGERLSPAKLRGGTQVYPSSTENRASPLVQETVSPAPSEPSAATETKASFDIEVLLTGDQHTLVEWVPEPRGERCLRWNGNDVTGQYTVHGAVPAAKGSFLLMLSWTRERSSRLDLGCFRLHQESLLNGGYIRADSRPGHNRIRFVHDGQNVVWLQARSDEPKLALVRLPS